MTFRGPVRIHALLLHWMKPGPVSVPWSTKPESKRTVSAVPDSLICAVFHEEHGPCTHCTKIRKKKKKKKASKIDGGPNQKVAKEGKVAIKVIRELGIPQDTTYHWNIPQH